MLVVLLVKVLYVGSEPIWYTILYPVIGEPPLLEGVVQYRLICVFDARFAESVGGAGGLEFVDGGVTGFVDSVGVVEASFDAELMLDDVIVYSLYT